VHVCLECYGDLYGYSRKAEWIESKAIFDKIKVNFENGESELLSKNSIKNRLGISMTKYNWIKPKLSKEITPVPVIQSQSKSFKDKMLIEITHSDLNLKKLNNPTILYRIKNNNPSNFNIYKSSFEIDKSSTIEAFITDIFKAELTVSDTISATFFKKPNNYTIDIKSKYNPQYHAGGTEGLIDGINGSTNWRKGDWQGYQSQDFEAIIDLQNVKEVSNFSATFLQDQRSWIQCQPKWIITVR
jgi:hypothetical protein